MIISSLKNRKVYSAYLDVCLKEAANDSKLADMLINWKKKYLKTSSNKPKVEKALQSVAELLGDSKDNSDLIDQITSYFVMISKYVDDEASNELANLLKEI
jgi:hypothetical protein